MQHRGKNIVKFTVGKKIFLGFGSMIILLLIMISFAYYGVTSIQQTYENILGGRVQTINQVRDLLSAGKEIQLNCRSYLLTGNDQTLAKFNASINQYNQLSDTLTIQINQGEEKQLLNKLNQYNSNYIKAAKEAIALKAQNNPSYLTVLSEKGTPLVNGFNTKFNEMIKYQNDKLSRVQSDTRKKVDTLQTYLLLLSILAMIFGSAIAYYIGRKISKPIKMVADAAETIASGNLIQEDLQINSQDELGDLAKSFNKMVFNLKEVIIKISEDAEQVAAASEELHATTDQTTQATEIISAAIQEVAAGAEIQGKSSEENALAMDEVAKGSKQIAESATLVKKSAEETRVLAEQGNQSIQKAIVQMNLIETEAKNTADSIEKLEKRSGEIGNIIELITNIADQTNLLALNAAIEAARAGEAGKGFAVVADEVRKLAEESRKSANQIVELIKEIQKETDTAYTEINASTKEVSNGKILIHKADEVFQQIKKAVDQVNDQIIEVSAFSEQISASTEQVTSSIKHLSHYAKEASEQSQQVAASSEEQLASIEEITASSESLSRLAQDLHDLTSKFKI